jgi:hypothetical protein
MKYSGGFKWDSSEIGDKSRPGRHSREKQRAAWLHDSYKGGHKSNTLAAPSFKTRRELG